MGESNSNVNLMNIEETLSPPEPVDPRTTTVIPEKVGFRARSQIGTFDINKIEDKVS